jgi:hypothetical protein
MAPLASLQTPAVEIWGTAEVTIANKNIMYQLVASVSEDHPDVNLKFQHP